MYIARKLLHQRAGFLGFVMALFGTSALAETITWYKIDLPPSSIQSGPLSGQGNNDELLKIITADWPEVEHVVTYANSIRIWTDIAAGKQVCYLQALRTPERAKIAYLADTQLSPPIQLIVRAETVSKLPRNAKGKVLLDRLLIDSKAPGLFVEGRSYGVKLDALLAARPPTSGLKVINLSSAGANVFNMLAKNRTDYFFDYDSVLSYGKLTDPALKDLVSLPIEGNDEPVTSSIACPRTPWGLKAITRIDGILAKHAGDERYQTAVSRWLSPETRLAYGAVMQKFYRERRATTEPRKF